MLKEIKDFMKPMNSELRYRERLRSLSQEELIDLLIKAQADSADMRRWYERRLQELNTLIYE